MTVSGDTSQGRGSEPAPVPVAIGLGSNVGDRLAHLQRALDALSGLLIELRWSRVYETRPLHLAEQPRFLNACATGLTRLEPEVLLDRLHDIERAGGRSRDGERYGPREIDLDILLYGDVERSSARLTIPHPRLHERAFALVPLAELAPNWQHERLNRSVARLAEGLGQDGISLSDLQLARPPRRPGVGERGEGS